MFKAGAAQRDITPLTGVSLVGYFHDRKAVDVLDPLFVKAVVMDDGETRIAFVLCDLIALEREYVQRAREEAERRCGIPAENIMIACTHTHTGPATISALGVDKDEEYLEFLVPRIADAIVMANHRLREAKIGWELGREERISFNRRYWMKDGTVRTNPGYNNPDVVRPAGPIDPEVGVIGAWNKQGKLIGCVVNYANHGTTGASGCVTSPMPMLMTSACGLSSLNARTRRPISGNRYPALSFRKFSLIPIIASKSLSLRSNREPSRPCRKPDQRASL